TIGENIAKVAIVNNPVATNQQVTGITVKKNFILPQFFYYWVYFNKGLLNFKANRATIPILNNKSLKSISIKYPKSLEFQRKVVEQLNMIQFSIDNRIEMIEILNKLTRSIYHKNFGDPVNNQKDYPLKKLSQIVKKDKIITYGITQAGPHIEDGVPYIKCGDIKDGKILIDRLNKTSKKIASKYDRSKCETGDVVLSIRASIGDCAIVPLELNGVNLTQGTARVSPNLEIVDSEFLFHTIGSDGFK